MFSKEIQVIDIDSCMSLGRQQIEQWNDYISSKGGKTQIKTKAFALSLKGTFVQNSIWHFELDYSFDNKYNLPQQGQIPKNKIHQLVKITANISDLSVHNIHVRKQSLLDKFLPVKQNSLPLGPKHVVIAQEPFSYKLTILQQLIEARISQLRRLNYNAATNTLIIEFNTCQLDTQLFDSIINVLDI